ncbi:MAG: DUF1624 domain-containing protein [Beijerinckiaceae bacterium]
MSAKRLRIEAVDVARGVALAAMGVYHFVWDLTFYRFVPASVFYDPRFQLFGHGIAVSFLALVGVSLALAAQGGLDLRAYQRRTGLVAAAAALVSAGTYFFMPDAFISFGILHCIVAASLLALVFTRAPWPASIVTGALIVLAPLIVRSAAFDPFNWFLGLGVTEPRTLDWRPLFPWTGFTLIGLGLGKLMLSRGVPERLAGWRAGGGVTRALAWGGRHSLAVYLLHQPLLIAIVFVASMASANFGSTGLTEAAQEFEFRASCVEECVAAGPERNFCQSACDCVIRDAKNAGLWRQVLRDNLSVAERSRFDALTRACLRPDENLLR